MTFRSLILTIVSFAGILSAAAQSVDTVKNFRVYVPVQRRFYAGNGLDFAMLSTSFTSRPGRSSFMTIPRFTALVNFGFTFHYDLNNRVGLLSGLGLRNMGFIEYISDNTIKRRVYSLGIPLGIKIGDLRNRNFLFAGGGIDLPFHYKEKAFVRRSDKEVIYSDWFGEQTPRVLPFFFAGHSWDPGITVKLQYYPTNFLNTEYEATDLFGWPYKPYQGYRVNLLLISLGIDIHYGQYRIQEREYQEMQKEREQKRLL